MKKTNCEDFDEGDTQVAPEGEFKAYPKDEEYLDEEYLDEVFPKEVYYRGVKKPESQMRGQAMVLLALAREVGKQEMEKQ